MQAVEILAKSVGMEVPNFSLKNDDGIEKRKKEKDLVLQALNDAMLHYKENLYKEIAKPAQEYIKKRKLTINQLNDFVLGYSVDYNEMPNYLIGKGYSYDILQKAGLVDKNQKGNFYDPFAYRLMFPLFNMYNECVGFSARILTNDKTKAKYRNSSNTVVFDKSNLIYGLNLLRQQKQKEAIDKIIIVEGQMDVIAMHKAGFKNAVACLGTAFTEKHAKQLKLVSPNVICCLDGDKAGLAACNKIVDILASEGFTVKALKLPNGNDPDEYIKEHGATKMQQQLDNAVDYIDFQIDYLAMGVDFKQSNQKTKFMRDVIALLDKLNSDSEKQVYFKHIRDISGIPTDILRQDVFNRNVTQTEQSSKIEDNLNIEDGSNKALKFILASMLYKKEYVNYNFNLKKYLFNDTYAKLYDLIMSKTNSDQNFRISSLYDEFNFDEEPNLVDIINYNFEENGNNEKYYNECLWNIVEKDLINQQAKLNEQFQNCTDVNQRKQILLSIAKITNRLKNKNMED